MRHGRHPAFLLGSASRTLPMGRCLAVSLLAHGLALGLGLAHPALMPQVPPQRFQVSLLVPARVPKPMPEPVLAPSPSSLSPLASSPRPTVSAPKPRLVPMRSAREAQQAVAAVAPASAAPSATTAISDPAASSLAATPTASAPASNESRREPVSGAGLDAYAQTLSALLARQRSYPSLAAMRGWEGEVRLTLRIARRGGLIEVLVQRSSGYEVLDRNAVQLVHQAAPLPLPPDGLEGNEFQINVPVSYRLRKNS